MVTEKFAEQFLDDGELARCALCAARGLDARFVLPMAQNRQHVGWNGRGWLRIAPGAVGA